MLTFHLLKSSGIRPSNQLQAPGERVNLPQQVAAAKANEIEDSIFFFFPRRSMQSERVAAWEKLV